MDLARRVRGADAERVTERGPLNARACTFKAEPLPALIVPIGIVLQKNTPLAFHCWNYKGVKIIPNEWLKNRVV